MIIISRTLLIFLYLTLLQFVLSAQAQNSIETAVNLPLDTSIVWGLNYQNPITWWKVSLPSDGNLNILTDTNQSFNLSVSLYSAQDIAIAGNQYPKCAMGTYYIKVTLVSGGGNYTIIAQFTQASLEGDTEPNSTVTTADTLDINVNKSGHLGYYSINYTETLHIDRTDWWKTILPYNGAVEIAVEPEEILNTKIYLYDQNTVSLLGTSEGGNNVQKVVINNLLPGTYYIKVSLSGESDTYGSYTIKNTLTPPPVENDPEPNDSANNAFLLKSGVSDTGHLGFFGNGVTDTDDWWKITTLTDGSLIISTVSDSTLYMDLLLYDQDKTELLSSQFGLGTVTVRRYDLLPGTYYVNAHLRDGAGYGSYTISNTLVSASLANDAEPNDKAENALLIDIDTEMTGHLGYYGNKYKDQYDWWKVNTSLDGSLMVTVQCDSTLNIGVFLFDFNSTAHLGNKTGSGTLSIRRDDLAAGTFYVRLGSEGTNNYGTYTVSITQQPLQYLNDPEPNNSADEASVLPLNISDTGHLGYISNQIRDVSDWWKVITKSDGALTITTQSDDTLNLNIFMYGSDKTTILAQATTPDNSKTVIRNDLAAGTYYLNALRITNQGAYSITDNFVSASLENDIEPNNSTEFAIDCITQRTYTGHLGYGTITFMDESDYYTFTLNSKWNDLYITSINDSTLVQEIYLFDINGKQLAYTNIFGTVQQLHFTNANPGSYFIRLMRDSGYGSYAFIISQSQETKPISKNYPPVIQTQHLSDAVAGFTYMFEIVVTDPDENDSITYEIIDGPQWLEIDDNGLLNGTPMTGDIGTNIPVLIRVSDLAGYDDYLSDTINVVEFQLSPPTDIVVSDVPDDQGHQIQISWVLSTDDEYVTHYIIYRSRNPEFTEPISLESLNSIEDLIKKEQFYTIQIATVPGGVNTFTDKIVVTSGVDYYYWLEAKSLTGSSKKVASHNFITYVYETPSSFRIFPPYPNPFNPGTSIRFELPSECNVTIKVYDILGRETVTLQNGFMPPGTHEVFWNGSDNLGNRVSSGIYMYRFNAGNDYTEQGKLLFLR
ncbi:MAG: T9SS type A sorting domain-containing protein [Candidatus Latescibacteria bacterium]|nr:T9SS type A sorting domain-containing protein [Candidatus Latescibacterota bacterium]